MPEPDVALLEDAAREAGEIAMGYWRDDPMVWDKGGDDPVSEADFAVDSHLKQRLLAARPDYAWISEETEDDAARLTARHVFVVDPIDGTRAYVAGEATWAHSLAVVENGVVTAACVFLPARNEMFTASLGGGASLNGDALSATTAGGLDGAQILTPKVTMQPRFWREAVPEFKRHFRPSLAFRLALVGQGRFDAMLTLRPSWEWDIAAGALIASEAGAKVTDRRGERLTFNTPARQTAGVVAGATGTHKALLDALAPDTPA